jgi:hypothetical protein
MWVSGRMMTAEEEEMTMVADRPGTKKVAKS